MNVLILHSELGVLRGGGENFTRNLFTAFASRGHRVTAAFVADSAGTYPIPLPSGIEPFPISGWWSRNLGSATLSTIGRYVSHNRRSKAIWDRFHDAISWRTIAWHNRRFQRCIERDFKNRWSEFDAVYVHGDPFLASNVARHRPTVLRLPGPVSIDHESELRAVHAVCANGDALVRIRSFLGSHATMLPVGVDETIFKPGPTSIRAKLHWAAEDRVVGYVGRLTHLKGVDLLATAFRKIAHTLPDARLLIVGSGEEELNLRSELAKEFNRKMVHIEPDVNHGELPQWYRAMNILVMPSRYENFSNALIEGMACGIPFLASNVGGNKILAKTEAGWLFETESVSSLAAYLEKLPQIIAELKMRGRIGFNYVKEQHSWGATAERLEDIMLSRLGANR